MRLIMVKIEVVVNDEITVAHIYVGESTIDVDELDRDYRIRLFDLIKNKIKERLLDNSTSHH